MEDAWGHILSHVPQRDLLTLERVNRNMRGLARREWSRQKEVDIQRDFPNATTEPAQMISIIERLSPALSTLRIGPPFSGKPPTDDLPSGRNITREIIEEIAKRCTRLKTLAIHRMSLTLNALLAFPLLSCTIEELTITVCRMECYTEEEGRLVQEAMTALVASLPRLRRFEIAGRGMCFDHFVLDERLLQQLPDTVTHMNLSAGKSLKLADLRFLKQRELDSFTLRHSFISTIDLDSLVDISSNIRHLDLAYSPNIANFAAISKLQFLKTLNLSNNRHLLDEQLNAICRGCPALVEVDLENCWSLTSDGLVRLGLLHSLQRLSLSGLPSVNLSVIEALTGCIDLARLDVSFCRSVDVSCLASLISDFPLLRLVVMKGNIVDRKIVDNLKGESILPFLECDSFKLQSFSPPPPLPIPPLNFL